MSHFLAQLIHHQKVIYSLLEEHCRSDKEERRNYSTCQTSGSSSARSAFRVFRYVQNKNKRRLFAKFSRCASGLLYLLWCRRVILLDGIERKVIAWKEEIRKGGIRAGKNVNPGDALVAKIPLQVSEEFENLLKTSSSEQKCLSANLDKQKMSISK